MSILFRKIFAVLTLAGMFTAAAASERVALSLPAADTLTVIQRPIVNIPHLGLPGDSVSLEMRMPAGEEIKSLFLLKNGQDYYLNSRRITASNENGMSEYRAWSDTDIPAGLYDLGVTFYNSSYNDTSGNAVCVIPAYRDTFYFIQVTDTHLPSHFFWGDEGLETDLTEIEDFRAVIDDINIIRPEFVLHTGDFINDGELEALGIPAISISKQLLYDFKDPVFMVSGNHDLGGWDATPAPDGTARRTWWSYFGWNYLNPDDGQGIRTQNYSFDYGENCHFIGLESYVNYDGWQSGVYGYRGFIQEQITWMNGDLLQHVDDTNILFYHCDFENDLDLTTLGVDAAFYGHIHRNSGDEEARPLNLATDNVCDGSRAYRVMEVCDGEITETQVLYAGTDGSLLSRQQTQDGKTVILSNNSDMGFNNCRIDMPLFCSPSQFRVNNAEIYAVDTLAGIVTVTADLPAHGSVRVEAWENEDTTALAGAYDMPQVFEVTLYPNPFNPHIHCSYDLHDDMRTRVTVVDMKGQTLAVLQEGFQSAGAHTTHWNGELYPSGIYLFRFYGENESGQWADVKKGLLIR